MSPEASDAPWLIRLSDLVQLQLQDVSLEDAALLRIAFMSLPTSEAQPVPDLRQHWWDYIDSWVVRFVLDRETRLVHMLSLRQNLAYARFRWRRKSVPPMARRSGIVPPLSNRYQACQQSPDSMPTLTMHSTSTLAPATRMASHSPPRGGTPAVHPLVGR